MLELAARDQQSLGETALRLEAESQQVAEKVVYDRMYEFLQVMRSSVQRGLTEEIRSLSGLSGGAARLVAAAQPRLLNSLAQRAMSYALAVIEVNASMGKIVAAPTAGSSGILPGVILAIADEFGLDDRSATLALFAGGSVGQVIGQVASLSGAEGGCQAECGSAGSMAAAAAVELVGGTPRQAIAAAGLALKNALGLACDPVAGLVEIPCIKRNAIQILIALGAAELALAGIESAIPADEVVLAMDKIGKAMPHELKETSLGGLADTPTAREIEKKLGNISPGSR